MTKIETHFTFYIWFLIACKKSHPWTALISHKLCLTTFSVTTVNDCCDARKFRSCFLTFFFNFPRTHLPGTYTFWNGAISPETYSVTLYRVVGPTKLLFVNVLGNVKEVTSDFVLVVVLGDPPISLRAGHIQAHLLSSWRPVHVHGSEGRV